MKFIDLFAGIGGFHYALSDMGFECVFASEKNQSARRQYHVNFPKTYINPDITKINPSYIPNHDILCGGFPCQPFSSNGLQKGLNESRGELIFYIFEILRIKKPKFFILENVKNLVGIDDGKTFKMIISELEKLNYDIKYQLVNASNFTAQSRNRIFITGVYNDKNNYDNEINPPNLRFPVKMVLRDNPYIYPLSGSFYCCNPTIKDGIRFRNTKFSSGFGNVIITENETYPCITRTWGYESGVLFQDESYRYLDIIELSRLQGFDDNIQWINTHKLSSKLLGNSVCIPAVKYVASKLLLN